jgi:hypothetical protein
MVVLMVVRLVVMMVYERVAHLVVTMGENLVGMLVRWAAMSVVLMVY